jgi:hypothetical protein
MIRGSMQLEFNIFNVNVRSRWYTREMTAFLPECKHIFPRETPGMQQSPNLQQKCHRSRVWAGYLGAFFGRLVTLLLDKDVKQARNETSDLIWRTGTEPAQDPDAPA